MAMVIGPNFCCEKMRYIYLEVISLDKCYGAVYAVNAKVVVKVAVFMCYKRHKD